MREIVHRLLPWVFVVLFAASRWPGLMPPNFSAAYALMFCAGVYLRGRMGTGVTFGILFATDMALNAYYQFGKGYEVFTAGGWLYLAGQYAAYAILFAMGRRFRPASRWITLVGGGILAALVFYVVTNTAAWWVNPFRNPEYVKTLQGWLTALTKGTGGYPETWTFFRNTLLSSGLFTALFAGSCKLTASESPADKGEEQAPTGSESEPEEATA